MRGYIPYSGYFSGGGGGGGVGGGNIFVVFVVEKQTMKYLPTKNGESNTSIIMLLACAVFTM